MSKIIQWVIDKILDIVICKQILDMVSSYEEQIICRNCGYKTSLLEINNYIFIKYAIYKCDNCGFKQKEKNPNQDNMIIAVPLFTALTIFDKHIVDKQLDDSGCQK
jgi:hypothetical protein